jgi:hypothetical protein
MPGRCISSSHTQKAAQRSRVPGGRLIAPTPSTSLIAVQSACSGGAAIVVRHGDDGKSGVLQGLSAALHRSLLSRSPQPLQHQRGLCERRASISTVSESRAEAERVIGVKSQRIQLRVFFVSRAPLSGTHMPSYRCVSRSCSRTEWP